MLTVENLKIVKFGTCTSTSDGEPVKGTERHHILLFNQTQISADEVWELVDSDMWEYSDKVIEVTSEQLNYLKDKEG